MASLYIFMVKYEAVIKRHHSDGIREERKSFCSKEDFLSFLDNLHDALDLRGYVRKSAIRRFIFEKEILRYYVNYYSREEVALANV